MDRDSFASVLDLLESTGHELPGVEAKTGGPFEHPLRTKVLRAMMGMANRRDGGIVIIGIGDNDGRLSFDGISEIHLRDWSHDKLADQVAKFADPPFSFALHNFERDERQYLVVNVPSFVDTPVICKQQSEDGKRVILRRGAIYYRGTHKSETKEAQTSEALREIIELATDKHFQKRLSWFADSNLKLVAGRSDSTGDAYAEELIPSITTEVASGIRSGGYLELTFYPTVYSATRIENVLDTYKIVSGSLTYDGGAGFPFMEQNVPHLTAGSYTGVDFDSYILQSWRMFQSGQFYLAEPFPLDYRVGDRPINGMAGPHLEVKDTIQRISVFCRFSSRLSQKLPGSDDIVLRVALNGINGRRLHLHNAPFFGQKTDFRAQMPSYSLARTLSRADLVADALSPAREFAREVFRRFGWDADPSLLLNYQEDVLDEHG